MQACSATVSLCAVRPAMPRVAPQPSQRPATPSPAAALPLRTRGEASQARALLKTGALQSAILNSENYSSIATDQRGGRVVVAFSLDNLVLCDGTELADRTVHRADQCRVADRTRTGFQRTGEKFVEGRIGGGVGIRRLGHVDLIARDKLADHPSGETTQASRGEAAGEGGERLFRHQVLRQYS